MFVTHDLLQQDGITHGFFGRRGGAGSGLYDSLNCGPGTQDDPDIVKLNRATACAALGVDANALLTLYQIHSDTCLKVTDAWGDERPKADAMATDRKGLALGVLTADCAPVLFYGKKASGAPVIGAAHAGWGGAFKGVLESTVAAMEKLGAVRDTLRAVIGPCIAQDSYEVGWDFRDRFLDQDPETFAFFRLADREGRWMFDLPGYAAYRLALAGVPQVASTGQDTYAEDRDYFSYRRSTHRSEPDYGRQLSVIIIP